MKTNEQNLQSGARWGKGRGILLLASALFIAGGLASSAQSERWREPDIDCARDKTVPWGSDWDFDEPEVRAGSCADPDLHKRVVYTETTPLCGRSYKVTRKWEVTDNCGYKDTCKQVVTVLDGTQPTMFPTADKTVECGSGWNFDAPTAIDPQSGLPLPVTPISTVTNSSGAAAQAVCIWEAADACGNKAQCSQTVFIVDTTAPTLVCRPGRTVPCGTDWDFDLPAADDRCSSAAARVEVASTLTVPLCGQSYTSTRTWLATDAAGNAATASQTITVLDEKPPVITSAPDKTVEVGTAWTFDTPVAVDVEENTAVAVAIVSTITNTAPGGVCVLTRRWSAQDQCGNVAVAAQSVSVLDTQPPVFAPVPPGRTYRCFAEVPLAPDVEVFDLHETSVALLSTTNGTCPTFITHTWLATDAAGNTASALQTNIIFVEAPALVRAPANQIACAGERVQFSVELSDLCGVRFEWSKDGQIIPGATGSLFMLESVVPSDAGNYCVRAFGEFCDQSEPLAWCASLSVRQTVAAAPLPDLTACPGESVVLSAPNSGADPTRFAWRKNGELLANATNRFLSIAPVAPDSGGVYSVEVTGECGSQTVAGTLTVRPAMSATALASQTRRAGESVTFSTVVSGATPLARVWRRNGAIIAGATGDSLTIPSVLFGDSGVYSVEITGPCNSVTQSATLTVVETPPPPANTPPSITPVADVVLEHNSGTGELPFVVGDLETPAGELLVSAESSDPMLLPPAYIILGGSGANRTVTVVAPSAGCGTVTIFLRVSDGLAATSISFKVTLRHPPEARSRLTIITHGDGQVLPDLNGLELIIGQSYTVRATPGGGQMFTGWHGGATGDAQRLTFVMTPGLVLDASFAPNAYLQLRSSYNGLFHEAGEVRHDTSGLLTLTLTKQGKYTGTLRSGGRRLRFSGKFDAQGNATHVLRRAQLPSLNLQLHFGAGEFADQIIGKVSDGVWTAGAVLDRAAFHAVTNRAPFAGRYTMIIPGRAGDPDAPAGDGYAVVRVGSNGFVTLSAALADGTRATQRVPLSARGEWPLYAALYGGRGSLLSWQTFGNRATDDLHGLLSWIRPELPGATLFPAGFSLDSEAIGSRYTPPGAHIPVLNLESGVVSFSSVAGTRFSNAVTLTPQSKVINLSSNQLVFAINKANGSFRGHVTDPETGERAIFKGALLQKQNRGAGFCPGASESGRVTLEPLP